MDIAAKLAMDQMDSDMARKYLANKLDSEQEEVFELWLAENPQFLEDLTLDLAFISASASQATQHKKPIHAKRAFSKKGSIEIDGMPPRNWVTDTMGGKFAVPAFGFGALIAALFWISSSVVTRPEVGPAQVVDLIPLRGRADELVKLRLGQDGIVVFRFYPSTTGPHVLTLTGPDTETYSYAELVQSETGAIVAYVDADKLHQGVWLVELADSSTGGNMMRIEIVQNE